MYLMRGHIFSNPCYSCWLGSPAPLSSRAVPSVQAKDGDLQRTQQQVRTLEGAGREEGTLRRDPGAIDPQVIFCVEVLGGKQHKGGGRNFIEKIFFIPFQK